MRPVILLFAKSPVPGRVKTRLIPPLSPQEAADLHTAFVNDLIERLQSLRDLADLELYTASATRQWAELDIPQLVQCEGDLGLKMFQALRHGLSAGRTMVMIVGTDAPTLPLGHLQTLLLSTKDVALGPAEDGGFYAIACRKISARMFENVVWSSPDALQQTLGAIQASGLNFELGLPWWDVDTPADLERLKDAGNLPVNTARILSQIAEFEEQQSMENDMTNGMTLKEGDLAPAIHLADEAGGNFDLATLKGKNVILYFYPKADTPGCTNESCEFRDHSAKFTAQDTVIVGVSPDKSAAQSKFKAKFDLPFTLLADVEHATAEAYGVWTEKSMYGKKYMGIERTTFLIGKDGLIRRIFRKVKPEGHAEEVFSALKSMWAL